MPKAQRPSKAELARLRRLPRHPDLVIAGGKRELPTQVHDGKQRFQPLVALWMDTTSGTIRASELINPLTSADAGTSEALMALLDALGTPPVLPLADNLLAFPTPGTLNAGTSNGRHPQPETSATMPGLPARVITDDAAIAEAARAMLQPLAIPVEHIPALPQLDDAFRALSDAMAAEADDGAEELLAWEIDPAQLPPLFKAAARLWRRAPWDYMPDNPPLAVALGADGPEPGVDMLFASILGGGGMVTGVAFYYSADGMRRAMEAGNALSEDDEALDDLVGILRQLGAPVDALPPDTVRDVVSRLLPRTGAGPADDVDDAEEDEATEDSLVVFFDPLDALDPDYIDWLAEHQLTYASRQAVPSFLRVFAQGEPRRPDVRETRALSLAVEALNQFFSQFGGTLDEMLAPPAAPLVHRARIGTGASKMHVEVTFPPPAAVWPENDEFGPAGRLAAASPEGQRALYRFKIALDADRDIWRRIELRGDQTLHDLHDAIQEAFGWDDDHLYAFFLSGKAWDNATMYESPYAREGRNAAAYRLEQLPLAPKRKLLYIFDFGDSWEHTITLEAISPGAVEPDTNYPRIAERHGENVSQYADDDDADDDDEET